MRLAVGVTGRQLCLTKSLLNNTFSMGGHSREGKKITHNLNKVNFCVDVDGARLRDASPRSQAFTYCGRDGLDCKVG